VEKTGTGKEMTNAKIETPSGKNENTENFPVATFLIRPDVRPHVLAFYKFARAADDVSDNPLMEANEKVRRLDLFAAALLGHTSEKIPSVEGLKQSLAETGVTPQHSLDLLTAFKRDATQLRYKDWADLMDYCRYSASPVGRHVLALHGIGEEAWGPNDALCSALQVINHVQDCADDYRELDRIYIPHEMLQAYGGMYEDLEKAKLSEGLRKTLDAMLDQTMELLILARRFPRLVPDLRLRMDVSVIEALAEKLVKLLRRRDPLCENVKLGGCAKVRASLFGMIRALT
jgi:squalene synthase HpnC